MQFSVGFVICTVQVSDQSVYDFFIFFFSPLQASILKEKWSFSRWQKKPGRR